MRKLYEKSLKLTELSSGGLMKEVISVTKEYEVKQ